MAQTEASQGEVIQSDVIQCNFKLEGIAPFGFSRAIQSKKNDKETDDQFEARIWRERIHADGEGKVYIPPNSLKHCLTDDAKYRSQSVPGKRNATYTKHYEAGIMVVDRLYFGPTVYAKDVQAERLFVSSTGTPGGGKRVWKHFPFIAEGWVVSGSVYIMDPVVTPEHLKGSLVHAGQLIGMGYFRPRRNGYWGRFKVLEFTFAVVES